MKTGRLIKKIPLLCLTLLGAAVFYAGFHELFFKGGFGFECISAWSSGAAFICLAAAGLLRKNRVNLRATGFACMTLCCAAFAAASFGSGAITIFCAASAGFFAMSAAGVCFFRYIRRRAA